VTFDLCVLIFDVCNVLVLKYPSQLDRAYIAGKHAAPIIKIEHAVNVSIIRIYNEFHKGYRLHILYTFIFVFIILDLVNYLVFIF